MVQCGVMSVTSANVRDKGGGDEVREGICHRAREGDGDGGGGCGHVFVRRCPARLYYATQRSRTVLRAPAYSTCCLIVL